MASCYAQGKHTLLGDCVRATRYQEEAAAGRITTAVHFSAKRVSRLSSDGARLAGNFPATDPGRHIGQHQRLHAAVVKRSGVLCVPYDFRHTFASRAANDEGMPLAILAANMGHANLRSTMKYVHTSQEHMDREMVRLDARSSADPVTTGPNGEEKGKAGIEQKVPSTAPNLLN